VILFELEIWQKGFDDTQVWRDINCVIRASDTCWGSGIVNNNHRYEWILSTKLFERS